MEKFLDYCVKEERRSSKTKPEAAATLVFTYTSFFYDEEEEYMLGIAMTQSLCQIDSLGIIKLRELVNQYKKEDETRLFPIYENVNTILHEMLHIFSSTEDAEEFTFTKKKKEWTWNNPETSISSNFMGANLLFDACLEDVCGKTGIRLTSGQWFTFEDNIGLTDNMKKCDNSSLVKGYNPFEKIQHWTMMETDLLMALECKTAIETSKVTKSITPLTVSLLSLSLEGPNKAYRIHNGVLEMATVDYVLIETDSWISREKDFIGHVKKTSSEYHWKD
ncbi:hypothetical protein QYM36_001831 [Artemia franciscana]|uniref:Spike glycoprotein G central domain-containing protein n=1 Tax=Artemia franciscana TaxID=6661 RepID=A0AA88IB30_ARTSF|nr:hypothetical protein QYM36_001831 [Artemia franciscana]